MRRTPRSVRIDRSTAKDGREPGDPPLIDADFVTPRSRSIEKGSVPGTARSSDPRSERHATGARHAPRP